MLSFPSFLALVVLLCVCFTPSAAYDTDCNTCGLSCSGVGARVYYNNNTALYTSTGPGVYPLAKLCDGNDNTNLDYNIKRANVTVRDRWTSVGNLNANYPYCCLCGPSDDLYPASGALVTLTDTNGGKCDGFTITVSSTTSSQSSTTVNLNGMQYSP